MPHTERFALPRQIIGNMTLAGWRHAPHAGFFFETDATQMLEMLREINAGRGADEAITINTVMLKIIAEGIKACPRMNGHIRFSELLARGRVTIFEQIDATVPVMLDGTLVALNLRGLERKNLSEIHDAVKDAIRRAKNSDLQQTLYELALHDTLQMMKRGQIAHALGRMLGFYVLDGGLKTLLHGAEKRAYYAIPETERLTRRDVEQGTITVTNPGSVLKRTNSTAILLDLVPPQIAQVAINSIRDRAMVLEDGTIAARKAIGLSVVFDHRALDAAELTPFTERVDAIMRAPEVLKDWV